MREVGRACVGKFLGQTPGGKGTRRQLAQAFKLTPQMVNISLILLKLWLPFLFISVDFYVHAIIHGGPGLVKDGPWWNHWIVEMCERSLDKTTIAQLDWNLMNRRLLIFLWLVFRSQFLNVQFLIFFVTVGRTVHVTIIIGKVNNGLPRNGCRL